MSSEESSPIIEEVLDFLKQLDEIKDDPSSGVPPELSHMITLLMFRDGMAHLYDEYSNEISKIANLLLSEIEPSGARLIAYSKVLIGQARIMDTVEKFFKPLVLKLVDLNEKGTISDPELTHLAALEYGWFLEAMIISRMELFMSLSEGLPKDWPRSHTKAKFMWVAHNDPEIVAFLDRMCDKSLRDTFFHGGFEVLDAGSLFIHGLGELRKEDFMDKTADLYSLDGVLYLASGLAMVRSWRDDILPLCKPEDPDDSPD